MSYHHNPIEPSDWTDPPDPIEGRECPDCDGQGSYVEAAHVEDAERTPCPTCKGEGEIFPDPADYEPDEPAWPDAL